MSVHLSCERPAYDNYPNDVGAEVFAGDIVSDIAADAQAGPHQNIESHCRRRASAGVRRTWRPIPPAIPRYPERAISLRGGYANSGLIEPLLNICSFVIGDMNHPST